MQHVQELLESVAAGNRRGRFRGNERKHYVARVRLAAPVPCVSLSSAVASEVRKTRGELTALEAPIALRKIVCWPEYDPGLTEVGVAAIAAEHDGAIVVWKPHV